MYPWWAYEEIKQRQDRAERAAQRRTALRPRDEIEVVGDSRRTRVRRSRSARSLALRLSGGAYFLIPGFAVRDWKAA